MITEDKMEKMYLSKKFTEPLEREDIINST